MDKFNVLLIGSGGREHALAWKIAKSPLLDHLFITPGNPGTAEFGTNVSIDLNHLPDLLSFIERQSIELVVVGPEQPLVDGLVNRLQENGIHAFGPSMEAAKLEGSKEFAKSFMEQFSIPTASHKTYSIDEKERIVQDVVAMNRFPVVLKADGLAAGKGVIICETGDEVAEAVVRLSEDELLRNASSKIIVEEFMEGEEASVFVISDGHTSRILHVAQDHKRIGDGDTGPNTGGMGAYCPAPVVTPDLMKRIEKEIINPTITGMRVLGTPYTGILYVGLMMTSEGPKVVEYNCRFGDPECQCILPALESDLLELMLACTDETLDNHSVEVSAKSVCCVVLASEGYPGAYSKGLEIRGIEEAEKKVLVFQAGTRLDGSQLLSNGGRVLNVVATGASLDEAIRKCYQGVDAIHFDRMVYRKDIGAKGLRRSS